MGWGSHLHRSHLYSVTACPQNKFILLETRLSMVREMVWAWAESISLETLTAQFRNSEPYKTCL